MCEIKQAGGGAEVLIYIIQNNSTVVYIFYFIAFFILVSKFYSYFSLILFLEIVDIKNVTVYHLRMSPKHICVCVFVGDNNI